MENENHTLCKAERLHSRKLIERLFGGGQSRSMSAFPLRVVYISPSLSSENTELPSSAQMLSSAPKRCFRRAATRNRVKRQACEAYLRHKMLLECPPVIMTSICLDAKLFPPSLLEDRVAGLILRVKEKIDESQSQ